MTVGEKVWNAAKGVGDVANSIVSVKGVTIAAGAGLAAIGVVAGATAAIGTVSATAAASIPSAITVGTGAVGAYKVGEGVYDVATAENEQEARSGGGEFAIGGLMVGGALASAKASLQCLKDAGVDVVVGFGYEGIVRNCYSLGRNVYSGSCWHCYRRVSC